ncbi:piggyBac transposable element-derived protein 4-like [Ischnura elegans]|uniref:piggyBac transposable element-derived protein 4-like n=1 Tax=Ischnura elegans TaxID=197161 RepID=UPI001ED89618|nr:piggyBac transposable element-derived protein 4-like [Ischnura elegans]XP_046394788.1 piggyBac transposable element-derived protein 4-like [Ischnura elegans]
MSNKRKYSEAELCQILDESEEEYFSDDSSDGEHQPEHESSTESDSDCSGVSQDAEDSSLEAHGVNLLHGVSGDEVPYPASSKKKVSSEICWSPPKVLFIPRHTVTLHRRTASLCNLDMSSDEMAYFLKVFPRSLIIFISQCTNKRLDILRKKKNLVNLCETDPGEILLVLGCMLVMSYNKVPSISDYWSHNPSLGNEAIKGAISRNRFQLLISKLYFTDPEQPASSSKTYYIDEVISCLKHTFSKARDESPYQSIDESMTKFKGRSALKQYLPLKPIKRGIKIWERCDAMTGYAYDLNVYSGKELGQDLPESSTLGERVVLSLTKTIRNPDVTLVFDRFFTSVHLLNSIQYPAVGTAISTRKNMPKFQGKLKRGEFEFLANHQRTMAARWQDSKEVTVLSNCHDATVNTANRKQKDGRKVKVDCPELICFYNKYMGGVDLSDQKVGVYDFDRRSNKWWKKVFYKVLMLAVVNSWILYMDTTKKDVRLLQFIVPLAEKMMAMGKEQSKVKRKRCRGRPSKIAKLMLNVGDHLPVEGNTRRRCMRCAQNKVEKRTKTLCTMCQVPLCRQCFTSYHT